MNISVAILTHNEEENIGECLGSILNQDFVGKWEIFVVDGNSTDRTVKIVESYGIRVINNPQTMIASGRNIAIWASKYPYLAFTDADCVVPIDWLTKLVIHFKSAGVGGGNKPPTSSKFYRAVGMYLDSFLGGFNSPQNRNFKEIRKVNSLSCSNALYDVNALVEVGEFDESLGNIGEDLDMGIRLRRVGYNLYFVPNASVIHKLRPDLPSWLRKMALYGRGRATVTFKHRLFFNPFFIVPMFFTAGILLFPLQYLVIMSLYVMVIKKGRPFFKGLAVFLATHCVYAFNLFWRTMRIGYG